MSVPKYRIELSDSEFAWARRIGLQRHNNAIADGRCEAHGHRSDMSEGDHVIGAGGELGGSKLMMVPWPAYVDTYKRGVDIEPYTHVRTRTQDWMGAYHRVDDPRSGYWLCVSVDSTSRIYTVHGYVLGCDFRKIGRYDGLRNGREMMWVVDQHLLRDAADLRVKPLPEPPVDSDIGVLADDYPFQTAVTT
jgi:hypothetical protein